jgi:ubiquinone/menaquinone biosynthesis C-methylase UbiE
MLPRILETEAMDTPAEAVDYDTMDHREVNRVFVADLLAAGPEPGPILDLGTGTVQIPIELCRQAPEARVVAVDLAYHMLQVGRQNVARAGLADRIAVQQVDAKRLPYGDGALTNVVSNSIVHHIPEPREVLQEAWRVLAPGGLIFLRDLFRPTDEQTIRRLVSTYAPGANEHQQQMFADSFRASLTVEEMQQLVAELGSGPDTVRANSDRHWTWVARKR